MLFKDDWMCAFYFREGRLVQTTLGPEQPWCGVRVICSDCRNLVSGSIIEKPSNSFIPESNNKK
jgi:hypothetical protein